MKDRPKKSDRKVNSGDGKGGVDRRHKRTAEKRVTLKHVAADAGVHPSTASRALSMATRGLVADDLVARVQESAARLGYRPNAAAASLRTGRSGLVGILLPDIANPQFSPILSGITQGLAEEGYSPIVADVGDDAGRQLKLAQELIARRVDGLILATASRKDGVVSYCLDHNVRCVLVNRSEDRPRVSSVISDDAYGMELAVEHLLGLGHRQIGHIAGPTRISTGLARLRGFQSALSGLGHDPATFPIVEASSLSREAGKAAAQEILASHPETTVIVAANDLLALGVYDALHDRGLACPEGFSVVGYSNMPLVDMVRPPLTTVKIENREMGLEAAQLLIAEVTGRTTHQRNVVIRPSLIVRESTSRPRKTQPVAAMR